MAKHSLVYSSTIVNRRSARRHRHCGGLYLHSHEHACIVCGEAFTAAELGAAARDALAYAAELQRWARERLRDGLAAKEIGAVARASRAGLPPCERARELIPTAIERLVAMETGTT